MDFLAWAVFSAVAFGFAFGLWLIFRPAKKIHQITPVARIEANNHEPRSYLAKARLFDENISASDEWWPLGEFDDLADALAAVRRFHADRLHEGSSFVYVEDQKVQVRLLEEPFRQ